jgi:GR25 family glycosyltransferase involved in LPS biosynthesis
MLGLTGDRFRGQGLLSRLQALGISCTFVEGIDARVAPAGALGSRVDQKAALLAYGPRLSDGVVACAIGHQMMYRRFVESHADWALILEDDAELYHDPRLLMGALRGVYKPTIVQLNVNRSPYVMEQRDVRAGDQTMPLTLRRHFDAAFGTYAYLINRTAAMIAVQCSDRYRIVNPADWPFLWRSDVEFWDVIPEFSQPQSSSNSVIDAASPRSVGMYAYRDDPLRLRKLLIDFTGYSSLRLWTMGYPLGTSLRERLARPLYRAGWKMKNIAKRGFSRKRW